MREAAFALWVLSGCGSVSDGSQPSDCYAKSECEAGEFCTFAYEDPTGDAAGRCLPMRSEDEPCEDGQCALGLACGNAEPRSCVAIVDEGEPCDADDLCADGLLCNHGYEPSECHAPSGEQEPCATIDDCVGGLLCNAGVSPSECRAPAVEGGECGETGDCVSGLDCTAGACTGPGDPPTTTEGGGCGRSSVVAGAPVGGSATFAIGVAIAAVLVGRRRRP